MDPEIFSFLKEVIRSHSGIHLSEKEAGVLRSRAARRVRELGLASLSEYVQFLQGPSAVHEIPALVDAVTVNYTFFFREMRHFQLLGSHVFPQFLADRRDSGGNLRGWSAGCSFGQEPYSIAMAFAEVVGDVETWDFRILATDISERVIRAGARGIYPISRLSGVPQEYRYKYLTRDGETPPQCLRIVGDLRRLIVFRRLNVLQDVEAFRKGFDFIFCRNVMIYFDLETQTKLLRKFHSSLRPRGFLFVSSNETFSGIPHPFHPFAPGVFRKG